MVAATPHGFAVLFGILKIAIDGGDPRLQRGVELVQVADQHDEFGRPGIARRSGFRARWRRGSGLLEDPAGRATALCVQLLHGLAAKAVEFAEGEDDVGVKASLEVLEA
jgi:hypothetical protein